MLRKYLKTYLLLAALVVLVYLPVRSFDFTNVDDKDFVTKLSTLFKDSSNIRSIFYPVPFTADSQSLYWRPTLGLSFAIDAKLWGQSFPGWHTSNIVIHLIGVSLVFSFFVMLGYRHSFALLASLLVAVHPALAQAVAWIPGRNDSLLAVFVLASLVSLVSFLRRGSSIAAILSVVCYGLALTTKETAIVLPLVAFMLAKIIKVKKRLGWPGRVIVWFGYSAATAAFLLVRTALIVQPIEYGEILPQLGSYLVDRLTVVFLASLGKIFLLGQLSPSMLFADVNPAWGLAALVLIGLLVLRSKRARKPFMTFGLTWFALFLLPSYPPHAPSWSPNLMDHRLYLPMIGLLIVVLESDLLTWFERRRKLYLLCRIVLVTALSVATISYSRTFQNELNWLKRVVKISPSDSHGQFLVGVQLYRLGQFNEALNYLQAAVALKPQTRDANAHIGLVLLGQGKLEQARAAFERELSFNPDSIIARSELERLTAGR